MGGGLPNSFASVEQTQTDLPYLKNSCNCVAFRFDDVQDHWLNNVQIRIIDTFYERKIPLTIGVIGDNFGKDKILSSQIIAKIQDNYQLDIANHGWQHEDFTNFSIENQTDFLELSNQSIEKSLGVVPTVFIPPLNSFNNDTLMAMEKNDFHFFSTEIDESEVTYQFEDFSIYHFPEGATTGILNKEKMQFEGLSSTETYADIMASIDVYGFAVITLHPQEFSIIKDGIYSNKINQDQIEQLNILFDKIKEEKISIVLISEINEKSSLIEIENGEIPIWVKSFATWWSDGQISDVQFARSIEHLLKINKINYSDINPNENNDFEIHIPYWVKNNAKWWSSDLVSEKEFVNGLQFLISNEIIKV